MTTESRDPLRERARKLGFYGMLEHWDEIGETGWIEPLIEWEEAERARRSLERRLRFAKIGRFKPMADFDWAWPKKVDQAQVEDLFSLRWIEESTNALFVGPNGIGKTMIAQNLAHGALMAGHSVRFITASEMLNDLAAQETSAALQRRIRAYASPRLLCLDEVGYLSYDSRHADLLFEVVTRRYGCRATVITTNKAFSDWNEVFPNATSVVTLVDRLVHHAEIIHLNGPSYRLKEAREETSKRAKQRATRRRAKR